MLVAMLLAGCAGSPSTSPIAETDIGLAHVHGLGVNPADGQLYVATHHGVFRVADGKAERMGALIQDTMGFTVAGDDRFLGSGHPDFRNDTILTEDMRPLLGLVESTDRAATWEGLSLQGDVDFHALAFAHDRVYGFDATGGNFMVTTDTQSWETRSTTELLSFAVSPDDADTIVGTTYDATVVASRDGGRSWQPGHDAPELTFVSWVDTPGLFGLGTDGSIHQSTDGGDTWQERGSLAGQPAALLAEADGLYAATSEAISRSTDGGHTWSTLYEIE
jgi:hypothetical protein